jgi:hypothetical protein
VLLDNDAITRLESELAHALAEPEIRVAFYLGVPGAYRKITVQVMDPSGRTLAFAKIATSPATKGKIEHERRILLRLWESEGLRGRVPEVLHHFEWQGSRVLLIAGGPSQPGPTILSQAHLSLCSEVFLPFAQQYDFDSSPMMTRMSEVLIRLGPRLPSALFARLDQALRLLRAELGPAPIPLSIAHRDFAPWNTRSGPQGLFVFDWDGAEEHITPLYDIFHFQAIQAALLDRREYLPDRAFLRDALDALWPGGQEYLPWLYLSYLLDMTLLYSEAQVVAPGVGEQGVWNWFGERIEAFLKTGSPL